MTQNTQLQSQNQRKKKKKNTNHHKTTNKDSEPINPIKNKNYNPSNNTYQKSTNRIIEQKRKKKIASFIHKPP
jgi:hypothetical protein